jgi:hypothetical protein
MTLTHDRDTSAEFAIIEEQPPVQPEQPAAPEAAPDRLSRLGSAPWWLVSALLHFLVIALMALITMSMDYKQPDDSVIMITELQQAPAAKIDTPKHEDKETALLSKPDIAATDPLSKESSDIVVPPDILAKAELGDHFETINPELPDTHSAFGNPDSKSFHSVEGNDESPGGGGTGGVGMDDLIGFGGAASAGSGGGFGGGNGTGVGIGTGAGKGSFGQRNGGGRKLMVARYGGSKGTENAVDRALEWLAYHQEADGHWNIEKYDGGHTHREAPVNGRGYDESVSALATLAFLGAGNTPKVGQYKDNVKRAIEWLESRQEKDGRFGPPRGGGHDKYSLATGALAMAEAYAMTRDPKMGECAQKAVDAIVKFQNPDGGWDHAGMHSTSVLGWMVMALKSARVANLNIPHTTFENALRRLDDVSEKDADGYYGYVGYISKENHMHGKLTMTAVGMVSLTFLGQGHETSEQARLVSQQLPEWKPGVTPYGPKGEFQNFYHWYYGTLGLFQTGGKLWTDWNDALKKTLLPNQRKDGDEAGSWDPVTYWDPCGGRVFSTAMGALCLEVYYRYLKLSPEK